MIEKMREINDSLIKKYADDVKLSKKYKIIKKILKDDNCFLKMDIEYAYAILRDLQINEEDLKVVYCELINI